MSDGFTFITSLATFITALAALYTAHITLNEVRLARLNLERDVLLKEYKSLNDKMNRLIAPLISSEEHIRTYLAVSETPTNEEVIAHRILRDRIMSNLYLGSEDMQNKANNYFDSLNTYYKYVTGSWRMPQDHPNFIRGLATNFYKNKDEFHSIILQENKNLQGKMAEVQAQIEDVESRIKQMRVKGIGELINDIHLRQK